MWLFFSVYSLQVFHCLSSAAAGGRSILVDGFAAAERLKSANPASYELLASTIVPFRYDEPGHSMANLAPVLDLHPLTKDLRQIRYTPSRIFYHIFLESLIGERTYSRGVRWFVGCTKPATLIGGMLEKW